MVIHDRGYARWKGDRTGRVAAVPVVLEAGLKRGIGIVFRRKLPAVLLVLSAYGPFVFGLFAVYFTYYVMSNAASMNPGLIEAINSEEFRRFTTANPETIFFYMANMQWPFVLVACVLVGAGLVAEDKRANALELYLSRPVTVRQYLLGKLATIGVFVAAVTVLPTAVLILAQVSVSWSEPGRLLELLGLLLRTLVAGAVWVALPSLTIVAASSLTNRARNAAILWLGVVIMLEFVISNILVEVFADPHFHLLKIGFNVRQVMAWVLGDAGDLDPGVAVWQSGLVLLAWAGLSLRLMASKVRPVEVVA